MVEHSKNVTVKMYNTEWGLGVGVHEGLWVIGLVFNENDNEQFMLSLKKIHKKNNKKICNLFKTLNILKHFMV